MSRLDRALGVARSLAIYHAVPLRHRRMRWLYSQFVGPGDLAFDIGAHAGNRTRGLLSLGCRVVALEPQPDFARLLRAIFFRSSRVEIIEAAVSDAAGRGVMSVSERTPTMTTLAAAWCEARSRDPNFAGVRWDRHIEVETTTLDILIERFGLPAFVKVDVEGSELAILNGLTRPVAALSFEYLPSALDHAEGCVARLGTLGTYRFNWSPSESYRLGSDRWLDAQELLSALRTPDAQRRSGDVYAQQVLGPTPARPGSFVRSL